MTRDGTHLVVVKNPKALEHLRREYFLIGGMAARGEPMAGGDALVARDVLQEAGFEWGTDFYLKKIGSVWKT